MIAHTPPFMDNKLTSRRSSAPHTSMFLRMLMRAAVLRRGRAASALLAMVVAAAVATAMLTLYVDVQAKLRKEFRNYGANVVVIAKDGRTLPPDSQRTVQTALSGRGLAVPFAYIVARTAQGQPIVVAGTDLEEARKLNSWWSVTSWPGATHDALVGIRAMPVVSSDGKAFDLSFNQRSIHLIPSASLKTGSAEDSRIYLSLSDFEAWTGVQPSAIEIRAPGSPQQINALVAKLTDDLPAVEVRAVRQIVEGEARVLGKTRSTLLASAVLIILTAALCVLSTLSGWVLDRRRDFAIMKALGASERMIAGFFAAEAALLGAAGAVFGFVIGVGVAIWIGRINFHAGVLPRLSVLPTVVLGSVGVALMSAALPIFLLRRVQPAMILKGE